MTDSNALAIGTRLGEYAIESILGSGGFGITYRSLDTRLDTAVALKEYFPDWLASRDGDTTIRPRSGQHQVDYARFRASFLQEARTLATFSHPNIVRVARVFEAHNTAYMVLDFEEGPSLEKWLRGLGRPPTSGEIDKLLAPLVDAIATMHARSFLHRDIAPDNIIVRPGLDPVLIDFGATRQALAERSQLMTAIVKHGYSPPEQYSSKAPHGPYSDI